MPFLSISGCLIPYSRQPEIYSQRAHAHFTQRTFHNMNRRQFISSTAAAATLAAVATAAQAHDHHDHAAHGSHAMPAAAPAHTKPCAPPPSIALPQGKCA